MRLLRASSIQEYARWYLQREKVKDPSCSITDEPGGSVDAMRRYHPGKLRDWFSETTRWNIVLLDTLSDLQNLVFLESDWTKGEGLVVPDGPNYRLLDRVAKNAIAGKYLTRRSANRHKTYYGELARGSLRLEGEDRVAICTAEESEVHSNPAARYYLLDGVGRCLPYMMLVVEHAREFAPVEAFCADR